MSISSVSLVNFSLPDFIREDVALVPDHLRLFVLRIVDLQTDANVRVAPASS